MGNQDGHLTLEQFVKQLHSLTCIVLIFEDKLLQHYQNHWHKGAEHWLYKGEREGGEGGWGGGEKEGGEGGRGGRVGRGREGKRGKGGWEREGEWVDEEGQ